MSKRIFLFLCFSFIFLSVSSDALSQTCVAPPAGLSDFWTGDRSSNDFIGANHGTLANGATFTDSGKVGPAFSLDGTDDFVSIPSINIGSNFTVELWIYPTRSASYEELVSNNYTSGNFGSLYFLSNHIEYWQGNTFRSITPVNSVPLNAWTHLALVYDGNRVQLYLNGVASGSPSAVHGETFNNPLRFGSAVMAASANFQGRLDEISLYNTALSAADVLSIFNANDKGKCAAPALLADDASVLEGNGGTTNLNFTVTAVRSSAPTQVNYATADGTATQPSDYLTASGLANIPASGSTTVSVTVNGDMTLEQSETLFLNLSNPSPFGVIIADGQAVGTIFSDDCTTSPLNIVNSYRAEGNANDSTNGAHGTLENGAAFAAGNTGQAFSLDGVNDAVLTPTINLGAAYTVELWIRPTSAASFQNLVANNYLDTMTLRFGTLYFNANHIEYWQGALQRINSPTSIPLNQWTHIALIYDGAVNRLYVNGVASGGASIVHTETFNNPVRFGFSVGGQDQRFQGRLDEITFFNRALSDAEILSIYNAGGGGKCSFAPSAASVSVGGRVFSDNGSGLSNVRITLTDGNGQTRVATTSSFGYYRFDEVAAGETYIFTVVHKRYSFTPQVVSVSEELTELNFTAQ